MRAELGVAERKLLVGIAFGYADESAAVNTLRVPRAELAATTRFRR
ncbi:hypothetical protein [Mycolicibacterium lacusdiani]|nr:hypothetical protein [Mycolicibacterium lacusdiani]